jgi:hypothetical protein
MKAGVVQWLHGQVIGGRQRNNGQVAGTANGKRVTGTSWFGHGDDMGRAAWAELGMLGRTAKGSI